MRRLLCLALLFTLACRENPSPESQAVTTAAEGTTATAVETLGTAPVADTATSTTAPSINGPKLQPIDEATNDPSLVAFRQELLAAVKRRDADAVVALADPKIRTSFGGGGGAADFRKALTQPGVWEDFEQLLSLGGKFQGESFWAPYVYSAWPDSHDAFEFVAVVADNTPLRESASASAPAIATLANDIVERVKEEGTWVQIKTADGKTGWVEKTSVRSPVGYRAGFLKNKQGRWEINALVAGD